MTLHEMLVEIKRRVESGEDKDSICLQVGSVLSDKTDIHYSKIELLDLMDRWPLRSEDGAYPVPARATNKDADDAENAFWYCRRLQTLWVGEYGALRMQLLDWLIRETAS